MASMYNKLFTKILDSSIWLEPTPTRIVWMTFIAVMDETGFVQFASPANVAHRARVSLEEAAEAIKCLEEPDANSSDPDNDGRRVERVPGGWMVLNAQKHREMVTRVIIKEQTKERVRRFREKKGNANVTSSNQKVTPSDTETDSRSISETKEKEVDKPPLSKRVNGHFIKPQIPEIREYCESIGSQINAATFFNHYETIGWKVGKNPMKDWKAAVRNWTSRDAK